MRALLNEFVKILHVKKIGFEFKISAIYVIFGGLWILFSDKVMLFFVDDVKTLTRMQTFKGWFYVLATGLLLFYLVRVHLKKLKQTEDELKKAKERAEEHNELKTAFISNISHEIRTPMNGIIGFSNLLSKNGLLEEKRRQYINYIVKNGKQLLSIVNNLLDISKIEAKQIELINSEFSVGELLNDVYLNFRQETDAKKLNFLLEKNIATENELIYADKTKLQQVLSNLVGNALKFTSKGFIKMGCYFEEQNIRFYVADSGIGIEPVYFDKIFDRFSQVEKGISKKFGGTGLGLAICKNYIDLMGGQIWVNSIPGNGAEFSFTIPYVHVEKKIQKNIDDSSDKLDWKKYTILVAEDEESNFMYIRELLLDTHVNLLHAENGQDAVDLCKDNSDIDLVLMDIKMPVMHGLDATMKIKQLRPRLPVIAQTAFAAGKDREMALAAGCDDYVAKPTPAEQLIDMITKYLPK